MALYRGRGTCCQVASSDFIKWTEMLSAICTGNLSFSFKSLVYTNAHTMEVYGARHTRCRNIKLVFAIINIFVQNVCYLICDLVVLVVV